MTPPTPQEDDARDAWLSEALRHAPDADVTPPAALSDMILREALAKARPAAMPTTRPRLGFWSRVWVWTAQPAVGAGLASMMVASLVGVMLWDRPLEANSPRSLPSVAQAPVAAPAPDTASVGATASPADTAVAGTAPPRLADRRAPPVEAAPSAGGETSSPSPLSSKALRSSAESTALARRPAQSGRRESATASADVRQRATEATANRADEAKSSDLAAPPDALAKTARTGESMSPSPPAVTAVPTPAPAMQAPVAAAPMSPAPAPTPASVQAAAAPPPAPAALASKREATAPATTSATSGSAAAGLASSYAPKSLGKLAAEPARQSLANLRAALAAEPASWSWQRAGGDVHRIDDALDSFLFDVDDTVGNRWTGAASGTMASTGASTDVVRLLRDGRVVHALHFDGRHLRWERLAPDAAGSPGTSTTDLGEAQARRIRRALDKLGP